MQATLDEKDYQEIASEVIKIISDEYDLVPKQSQIDDWLSLSEFTQKLPVRKSKEWVRMFILRLPEFKSWVVNVNAGKGHPTRVNATKALAWVNQHQDEINWNQSLPQ